ncbi:hypothetical protein BDV93DRAFT_544926 [Ceratobasidium sp. AG-I]|nr:hypothetical protein BDV93DRAFT_544926 [Ceratobasidium sp. AG-I]
MRVSLLAISLVLYFDSSLALSFDKRQSTNATWSGPLADGGSAWKSAFAKAKAVVAKMTVEEKVNITTGIGASSPCAGNTGAVPRLGIPSFCLQDGPTGVNDLDLDTAAKNAFIADTSIVFTYAYQTESFDRDNLTLWSNGDALISTVAAQCNNTIVVIHSGQQVLMENWIDNPNVTAVLFAYYPGQETGNAIASVLYGDVNPSGKLPFTLAKAASDFAPNGIYTDNVTDPHITFEEGNLIDYRWFDAKNIAPRFEFGFGLSYTTFNYSTIKPFDGKATLYDVAYTITATVKNTGSVTGCEVAQMYLSYPSSETSQPVRSLRGFEKLCLAKGQSKTATFKLRQKDHAVWDVTRQTWTIPKGQFTAYVGSSSRALPLKATFTV